MKSNKNRNWHQESINDNKIKEYLQYILDYQNEQINWYVKRKKERKIFSHILLNLAIILFGASLIFPLIPGVIIDQTNQSELGYYYAMGYIFLITTTLILLGDRLFGHSNGWVRYTMAYLQIDSISSEFHGKWIEILPQLEVETISVPARLATIQLLQKFDAALKNIIQTETENWKNIFTQQLSEFSKNAEAKLVNVKKEIQDFNDTTQKKIKKFEHTHLKIEFKNVPKDYQILSKLYIDSNNCEIKNLNSKESNWILMNLPIGDYLLEYVIESDLKKRILSRNEIISIDGEIKVKKIEIKIDNIKGDT